MPVVLPVDANLAAVWLTTGNAAFRFAIDYAVDALIVLDAFTTVVRREVKVWYHRELTVRL